MSSSSRLQHHERLMSRMAEANGVDLDLAMQRGDLGPDLYLGAAKSCTGCSDPERCERFLDEGRSGIPDFCRNGDMIRRLADASPASD